MNMFPYSDFVGQILPRVEIDGAVSNWKDDSEEYHRIQDILMDIKTLMKINIRQDIKEIEKLAELIESCLWRILWRMF